MKKYGISCHNMKFLHNVAELSHAQRMEYLSVFGVSTTSGYFEARITKFIVCRHPLQFTHCTEIRFLWHCLIKSIVTFTPVIQFCIVHLKTLPIQSPTSHFRQYIVVHYFTLFTVWRLLFSVPTRHELWDFLSSSACVAGILYMKWSLHTSLPAGLLFWPWTWISVLALASDT
jgi:hypothetical protein